MRNRHIKTEKSINEHSKQTKLDTKTTRQVNQYMNVENRTLFIADNLDIMRGIDSETIDLIYLDPPFNTNRNYQAPIGSAAEGAEFKDIWTDEDVKDGWYSEIAEQHPHIHQIIQAAEHTYNNSMMIYLMSMGIRLIEMKRILKPTGSIYLHCDSTASHYLKMILDSLFGKNNFRDEIIWQRAGGRAKGSQYESKSFGKDTDNILHYSKSKNFTHNQITIPLTEEEIEEKFPLEEPNGRRYNTGTPLFCQPSMGPRPNLCYEYNGVRNPHPSGWRVSRERLIEMDQAGEIIWREGRRPLRKSYADKYKGKPIGALWIDIPIASGNERTGYPTQKPLALLERIIEASSNEDEFILDPFCGCATACVAAEKLQRKWIGIDISPDAEDITLYRLHEAGEQGELLSSIELSYITIKNEPPIRTDTDPEAAHPNLPNYTVHKNDLYGKQEGFCNGCRDHFKIRNLTVDHIVPQSRGGTDHPKNLQLLCQACNSTKGDGTHDQLIDRLREQGHIYHTQ